MARGHLRGFYRPGARDRHESLTWDFPLERVTGIEPALSAWEVHRSVLLSTATCDGTCP